MGASQSFSFNARVGFTVVHLFFVPALVHLARRKHWIMFTCTLIAAMDSIMMHLCQISPQYGLTEDNFCWYGSGTDVQTGTSLADYVTAYGLFVQFFLYGPDVTRAIVGSGMSLYYALAIVIMSTDVPSVVGPIVLVSILVVLIVIFRVVRLYLRHELGLYWDVYINVWSFVVGAVLIGIGGICYLFQNDANYDYIHDVWMSLAALGFYFLLRGWDQSPIIEDLLWVLAGCKCVRTVSLDPVKHEDECVQLVEAKPSRARRKPNAVVATTAEYDADSIVGLMM